MPGMTTFATQGARAGEDGRLVFDITEESPPEYRSKLKLLPLTPLYEKQNDTSSLFCKYYLA